MFCYQCEQTVDCSGCTKIGVCGKKETTSTLQDLIIHVIKGTAFYYDLAISKGRYCSKLNKNIIDALFTTVTNVNFDDERLKEILSEALVKRARAKELAIEFGAEIKNEPECATFIPAYDMDGMVKQAEELSVPSRNKSLGEDVVCLQELLMFGLKGMASYAHHAMVLGQISDKTDEIYKYFAEALAFLATNPTDTNELLALNLKCGEINLKVMEALDGANTGTYGHPEPTQVRVTPIKGKSILVSGHDLKDLEELLKQTEGKGINVYTHGEMLPCLAYPELKKYKHLVGNYGGAWQDQRKEFSKFPGAILMTTNCIQNPKGYANRIFTCGLVAWNGVEHIADRDFTPVINSALEAEGFLVDEPEKLITIGFAHNAVLGSAEKVIELVKAEKIKHFFLVGGCDGSKPGRNYYAEFAKAVPDDTVIMTLACGKYRFNKFDFGDIEGLPRLLDIGQCNDAYSAIKIAVALSEAFGVGVNELPLSMILSWYEQKAVCILLTLLHLGIKNVRLGPSLPAFITPNVLDILVENYNIMPITTAEEDIKAILG